MNDKAHTSNRILEDTELAKAKLEIVCECYAAQVIQRFNSHPAELWLVEERSGSKRDLYKEVVNIIANMTVNIIGMNKTELWQGINRAPNKTSNYQNYLCVLLVDHVIMVLS